MMETVNNSPKVFLAYSHTNKDWARSLAEALRKRGVTVWFDEWALLPGDRITDQIEHALRESEYILMLVGEDNAKSPWIAFELGAAIGMDKTIVPVVSPTVPIESLAGPIRSRKFLRNSDTEQIAEQLSNEIFKPNGSGQHASA